jgi:hypothetical protein
LLDTGLLPRYFLPHGRERILHLEKLPASHEHPLFLQLQPRDQKLHAEPRTRRLMNFGSQGANLSQQGIL